MRQLSCSSILGGVLALALVGCSSTTALIDEARRSGGSAAAPEASAHQPAFHFRSGDLPLGDFDYKDIKDDMFSPCEEISDEELAEIGLEKVGGTRYVHDTGVIGCGLVGEELNVAFTIGASPTDRSSIAEQPGRVIREDASVVIPGMMLYRGREAAGLMCVSAVDTTRGQLGIAAAAFSESVTLESLCERAQSRLEILYSK